VTFKGLLSLAHEEGLRKTETTLVQAPSDANGKTAIVAATVQTRRGSFSGIGDASPQNVNRKIAPHVIRMAETRAIARALRVAVNIGEVAIEELSEDYVPVEPEVARERPAQPAARGARRRTRPRLAA